MAGAGSFALTGKDVTLSTIAGGELPLPSRGCAYRARSLLQVTCRGRKLRSQRAERNTTPQCTGGGDIVRADRSSRAVQHGLRPAAAGAFALTGQAVNLQRREPAGAGSFVLTGQDITPRTATVMPAAAGTFALVGKDVTPSISIAAGAGAFALTGQAVTFPVADTIPIMPRRCRLSGSDITVRDC